MKAEKYYLRQWHLTLILLAGTVIRFMYGYGSKAWLGAPDQLAWGLNLDEMVNNRTWHYVQLVHAPHEGGSFFISLFSLLFRPLQCIMPPLSFAALVIDTVSRWIQIRLTRELFGNETAFWFGIWTILSVPLILPWGTVNYGLHSLFSFIPFVFFYFTITFRQNKYLPVICGIMSGIAMYVSYDNVILAMAAVFFLFFIGRDLKSKSYKILVFLVAFVITVLPHVFIRIYFSSAFTLGSDSALSIRGAPLTHVFTTGHFMNLCTVWFTSLPASFLLSFARFLSAGLTGIVVSLFVYAGIIWFVLSKPVDKWVKLLSVNMVILFVMAYAFSPFYGGSNHNTSYVYYRHWCYIIPFVTVMMIQGFIHSGRLKLYVLTGWLLLCGTASFQYISSAQKIEQPVYRAAGWVLANKYGNDLNKLFQIHTAAGIQYREELLVGYGWGLSAAILKNKNDQTTIDKLTAIIRQCPGNYQPAMIRGVFYSFNKGITPVLDPQLLPVLRSRFTAINENSK